MGRAPASDKWGMERPGEPPPPHRPAAAPGGVAAALGGVLPTEAAARVEAALDEVLATGDARVLARALTTALVDAGAGGAELWHRARDVGWRRVAAAGAAVPGAEACAEGRTAGYPGRVAAARADELVLAFLADHPGTDRREALEDAAETLLALAGVLAGTFGDPQGSPGGSPRPAGRPERRD